MTETALASPPALAERHLADFARDGWIVVEGLVPASAARQLSAWVDEVAREPLPGETRLHYFEQTEAGRALCRTERYIDDHAGLRELIAAGVLPAIASTLIGEPAVIYKEKVNYKQPGGAGFNPHQDATAYAFIERHVTCMVAVDAMTRANGCLEFSPYGGHELLAQDGDGCIAPEVATALDWRPVEVAPGGVVFFTSYVPHRSGPNTTGRPRRALYLTYNALAEGDQRRTYYDERDRVLAQRQDGEAARISTIGHFQGRKA